jgi:serine/threonine protein kinase
MSVKREEISSEDPEQLFRVLEMIGQGSFGIVCTCVNTSDNKIYAVKFIEINEDDGGDLQNEIDILKATANCSHVVKYFGSYLKENYLMIVMEYCDGGSVLDVMQVCNRGMTEQQISSICLHALKGLQYMHNNKILHRDIKAGNILLSNTGAAKLADFGVSTKLLTTIQKHKTVVGSPYWMSPEVIVAPNGAGGYDHKADIWSLGITAIEMAETKPPHYDINPLRVIFVIPNRTPPTLKEPGKWSAEFNDFVAQCLRKNATERPSAAELLNHPFITQAASSSESVIAALVEATVPLLEAMRKASKDREEDVGGTVKAGTVIQVNTKNRTAFFADDDDPYSTVHFNPANGGSYSSDSGSVVYKD